MPVETFIRKLCCKWLSLEARSWQTEADARMSWLGWTPGQPDDLGLLGRFVCLCDTGL